MGFLCILLFLLFLFPGVTKAQKVTVGVVGFSSPTPEGKVQGEQLAGRLYTLLQADPFLEALTRQQLEQLLNQVNLTREEVLQEPERKFPVQLDLLIFGEIQSQTLQYHLYSPRNEKRYRGRLPFENIQKGASALQNVILEIMPRGIIESRERNAVTLSMQMDSLFFQSQRLLVIEDYHRLFPEQKDTPFPNSQIILGEVEITQIQDSGIKGRIVSEDYPIQAGHVVGLPPSATRLGDLHLDSQPSGSRVYLGNHFVGETPLTIQEIPAGSYRFRFQQRDYQSKQKTVTVKGGTRSQYIASLTPQPARVEVKSNRPATVYVEMKRVGETPWEGEIPPGHVYIQVEAPGYPRVNRSIYLRPAGYYNLYLPIHGEDGSLSLTSNPPGARIWLDGEERGKTPLTLTHLEPGYHQLKLELPLYQTLQKQILVSSGEEKKIELTLEEAPGFFTLITHPSGANIYLEGKRLGTTPTTLELPRGSYQLTLKKEGFASEEVEFLSLPEKEEETTITLIQLYGTLEILSDPMGAHVYREDSFLGETPLLLEHHPAGRYTFTLKKDEMKARRTVLIPGEAKKSILITLEREPFLGGYLLGSYDPGMMQKGVELGIWAGRKHQLGLEMTYLLSPDLGGYGFPYAETWCIYRYQFWEGLGIYLGYQFILEPVESSAFSSGMEFQVLDGRLKGRLGPYLREESTGFWWDFRARLFEQRFSPLLKVAGHSQRRIFFSLGISF